LAAIYGIVLGLLPPILQPLILVQLLTASTLLLDYLTLVLPVLLVRQERPVLPELRVRQEQRVLEVLRVHPVLHLPRKRSLLSTRRRLL
jgi:hypothetical protein